MLTVVTELQKYR